MRLSKLKLSALLLPAVLLASCVTINVYFPAAEAQKAAEDFVEDVIGEAPAASGGSAMIEARGNAATLVVATLDGREAVPERVFSHTVLRFDPVGFVFPSAHAQENVDLSIRTPAIQAIQMRMAERFESTLKPLFDGGALGFANDGLVVVRDASAIPLAQRTAANQAMAEDNRDRKAVYREIAVANGHPEWEDQIRQTFAKQWVTSAHAGWWYQDSAGAWKQK